MGKIVKCIMCGKEELRRSNAKYCHDCIPKHNLILKEMRDVGRWTIFSRDEFKCVYCGKSSIEDGIPLSLDHVFPYGDIKDNTIYNLVTCCSDCNMAKSDRHLAKEVYERIIERNTLRNKGISIEMQKRLNDLFEIYYTVAKFRPK